MVPLVATGAMIAMLPLWTRLQTARRRGACERMWRGDDGRVKSGQNCTVRDTRGNPCRALNSRSTPHREALRHELCWRF
jgi:hypothetical protein